MGFTNLLFVIYVFTASTMIYVFTTSSMKEKMKLVKVIENSI